MARRLQLHEKLCEILGSRNAYFQPPPSVKLNYPCIIYKIAKRERTKANNASYIKRIRYDVTVITKDPDSDLPDRLLDSFLYIEHDRTYPADNLYHDVFTLYY